MEVMLPLCARWGTEHHVEQHPETPKVDSPAVADGAVPLLCLVLSTHWPYKFPNSKKAITRTNVRY